MSENKMAVKPMYKCAICDGVYNSIEDRMNCERVCLEKQKEEAKKALEAKKKKEEMARHKEVCEAIDRAEELTEAFIDDYGYFDYNTNIKVEEHDLHDLLRILHVLP